MVRTYTLAAVALLGGCASNPSTPGVDAGTPDASAATPIHFAVMVHLEGNLQFPTQQSLTTYDQSVRSTIDLFSTNGGRLTVESEKPYADAAAKWAASDNALKYSLSKGMGVGTHCDMTDNQTNASDFATNKGKVDAHVGAENNLGCSGGWVKGDWANAAYDGGFKYLDGVVMRSYLGVPEANRPVNPSTGKPYTDTEITTVVYHDPAPQDLMQRIYPRKLANTNDLEGDADGRLLLLTGEIGEITSLYEGRSNCFPNCMLTQDDFDAVISTLEQVYAAKDHSKFAMMYMHFPMGTLRPDPGGLTTDQKIQLTSTWLQKMGALQSEGKIVWVTMKEAYEGFVAAQ